LSLFEFLGVLISVVMGLGIAHILSGMSKTIHLRDVVRPYWVHTAWSVNTLFLIITIWWGMFWWSSLEQWHFYQYLFVISYAIVLFLAASILYPWDVEPGFDFEVHFYRNRPFFFGILALAWAIDIPETILKADQGLRSLPELYLVVVPSMLVLSIVAAITGSRRFHAIFAVMWLATMLTYLGLTTLSKIAG
jgi:hypothetical protein